MIDNRPPSASVVFGALCQLSFSRTVGAGQGSLWPQCFAGPLVLTSLIDDTLLAGVSS